tara:strand:+ start:10846 stop:11064 length:219 start_codon:yes stop_codon:yes gene_type:complete
MSEFRKASHSGSLENGSSVFGKPNREELIARKNRLLRNDLAMNWLKERGIDKTVIEQHDLGLIVTARLVPPA